MIWVYYSWLMLLKRQLDFIKKFQIWHWLFDAELRCIFRFYAESRYIFREVSQYTLNDKAPAPLFTIKKIIFEIHKIF